MNHHVEITSLSILAVDLNTLSSPLRIFSVYVKLCRVVPSCGVRWKPYEAFQNAELIF